MTEEYLKYILIGIGILALFIKIPKIEVPIWKWILSGIGKSINDPVMKEIKDLKASSDKADSDLKGDLAKFHEETTEIISALNDKIHAVDLKVDSVSSELREHIESAQFTKADEARQRIIDFSDLIAGKKKFSREAWRKALKDCDDYIAFCKTHKDYPNTEAEASIANIKTSYQHALEYNDFLY